MGVSKTRGTPKSSILIGFSIKPSILGYPYFWKHPYDYINCILFRSANKKRFQQGFCQFGFAKFSGENRLDASSQDQGEKLWFNSNKDSWNIPQVPQNTNMKGFPNHQQVVEGFWGMFQGYIGDFLEIINPWKSEVSLCECDLHGIRIAATCDATMRGKKTWVAHGHGKMSISITVSPQASMESPCLNRIMQPRHPVILSENDVLNHRKA